MEEYVKGYMEKYIDKNIKIYKRKKYKEHTEEKNTEKEHIKRYMEERHIRNI